MNLIQKIRWASRKWRHPVRADALVLDVGSGGNPSPFADVLVDRFLGGSSHRCGRALRADRRPLVVADGSRLPFRDKQFDYVICSHVLEHIPEPRQFLDELARVGRGGYIETPNAVFERLIPYDVHCLEVTADEGGLVIAKKPQASHDQVLSAILAGPARASWQRVLSMHPELFHVRFYWHDVIPYRILNENVDASWIGGITPPGPPPPDRLAESWRETCYQLAVDLANSVFVKLTGRGGRTVDLDSILVCPDCRGSLALEGPRGYRCKQCNRWYRSEPLPTFVDD